MLPEATETEEDLLDQAPFLEMNSRLLFGITAKKTRVCVVVPTAFLSINLSNQDC